MLCLDWRYIEHFTDLYEVADHFSICILSSIQNFFAVLMWDIGEQYWYSEATVEQCWLGGWGRYASQMLNFDILNRLDVPRCKARCCSSSLCLHSSRMKARVHSFKGPILGWEDFSGWGGGVGHKSLLCSWIEYYELWCEGPGCLWVGRL